MSLSSRKQACVGVGCCLFVLVLLLITFGALLTPTRTLFHPDWAPYFEAGWENGFWRTFVEVGRVPSFMYFMWALLPDRLFHALFYPVMTFAIWAVLYVFFRNRKLPWAAAMAGALAGAFSGYLLTLVSAGHRGVSEAMLSAVIVLLCIDRVVGGGGIRYGVAAALAVAFTLGTQPDVLGMLGLFLAAYAVMACWANRQKLAEGIGRFSANLAVAVLVFAVAVLPAVQHIRESFLPGREVEISRSVGAPAVADEAVSAAQRWEFVTNWSLPPADTPELILPLFFGTETTDRSAPFWGELGRSLQWEPGRPGFRNFRQHTIYMGLLQCLLALFACGCVASKRCRQTLLASGDESRQVIFWWVCVVLALLLSFGRYTPFYRLFYAVPFAHTIRAPIKFLHVVNLAVAILTAYGASFLLRAFATRKDQRDIREVAQQAARWLAVGAGGLAGFLLLVAFVVLVASASIAAGWSQMGFDASLHPVMRRHMFMALWRSIVLAAGFSGCLYFFILRRRSPAWSATALGVILCAVIGLDMAVTARRFVKTMNLSVHESQNAIVEDVRGAVAPRVMDLLTSRQPHDPLRVNFAHYHAASVRLLDDDLPNDAALLAAVGNDFGRLLRLLQITGTEYVVGPREQLAPWLQHEAVSLAGEYDYANRIIRAGQGRQGRILLLRVQQVLPRVSWMPAVQFTDEKSIEAALFTVSFDPWQDVLLTSTGGAESLQTEGKMEAAKPAKIADWSRWRVVVEDVPLKGGILLLNEPYHKDWKAYADGQPVDIRLANGAMMSVHVPTRTSQITFLRRPGLRFFWISTVPGFVLLMWITILSLHWGWQQVRYLDVQS